MNTSEFVQALSNIELVEEEYLKSGFTKEEFEEQKQAYKPVLRDQEIDQQLSPIESLLKGYDVSKVEIGMITFNSDLNNQNDYILFGKHEVDDLAISLPTNELVLLEEGSTHIMQYCASNDSNFFKALVEMVIFLEKRAFDDKLYEDEAVNLAVAETCAELAGGHKYLDFYITMTGF